MRKVITVEIDIDDKYVEQWNKNHLAYHSNLYKNEEKAQKALDENPLEKEIAHQIEKSFPALSLL